jgi:hypothetical protein
MRSEFSGSVGHNAYKYFSFEVISQQAPLTIQVGARAAIYLLLDALSSPLTLASSLHPLLPTHALSLPTCTGGGF